MKRLAAALVVVALALTAWATVNPMFPVGGDGTAMYIAQNAGPPMETIYLAVGSGGTTLTNGSDPGGYQTGDLWTGCYVMASGAVWRNNDDGTATRITFPGPVYKSFTISKDH